MSAAAKQPKILHTIVCDDIRREDNGKLILIGVYGNDIGIPAFPANIRLSILVTTEFDQIKQIPIGLRIMSNRRKIVEGGGTIEFDVPGRSIWAIQGIPISVKQETTLDIQVKIDKGRYRSVIKVPIVKRAAQ